MSDLPAFLHSNPRLIDCDMFVVADAGISPEALECGILKQIQLLQGLLILCWIMAIMHEKSVSPDFAPAGRAGWL